MATLSEVTLQHSRDLSALDADCRAQQEAIERARQNALQGLAAAAPALRQYNDARNEAATIRDNTVAHAAAALEAARLQARDERFDQLDTVQQQYVAADRAADDAKAAAQKKENDAYQAKLATINALPLGQQFAAREAAAAEHDKALAEIEAAWRVA